MNKLEKTALDEAFVAHFATLFNNLCLGWSTPEKSLERYENGLLNLREAYTAVLDILNEVPEV